MTIHVLNAGKGDSIVLEHESLDGVRSYGVIDSNGHGGVHSPALAKLQELGAESLSFVMLTHPHADHFSGLEDVVAHFSGSIERIFTFPIERNRSRLENMARAYARGASNGGSRVNSVARSFLRFFAHGRESGAEFDAPSGLFGLLPVQGFDDVDFYQVLPPSSIKGRFFESLDRGTFDPEVSNINELSLAIMIEFQGVRVLLGADGTHANWLNQFHRLKGRNSFRSLIVKLPHHGSRQDCSREVLQLFFQDVEGEKVALISASGGRDHPAEDVLRSLRELGVKPYCTNLSTYCGGGNVVKFRSMGHLAPELGRFISSVLSEEERVIGSGCQGNISVQIMRSGAFNVSSELGLFCPYRAAIDGL